MRPTSCHQSGFRMAVVAQQYVADFVGQNMAENRERRSLAAFVHGFYAIHEDMLPTLGIPPLLVGFVLVHLFGVLFVSGARPSFLSSRIAA